MSTLAACRADNFYRPNDYDPNNRKKEIEKKRKEGKLKIRKQGARKIRFEMPFHIRCTECSNMIAKGVRFNAEKKKAGRYLGTLIFQFTMPCPSCKNTFIIKTDPKSCEYLLVSGCIRYNDDYCTDTHINETVKIQTPEEGEQLNRNPFLKLETQKIDINIGEAHKPILYKLIQENEIYKNDFCLNQTLRRNLKCEKNKIKREEEESKLKCVDIKLLPLNEEDKVHAVLAKFKESALNNQKFNVRDTLRFEPIFTQNKFYSVKCKNEEIKELINKKHKLDKNIQFCFERAQHQNSLKNDFSFSKNLKLNKICNIKIKRKED